MLLPIPAIPTSHPWSHQTMEISFDAIIKNKQKAIKEKRLIQKYVVRIKLWKELKVHVWICNMKFWYVNLQQPTCSLISQLLPPWLYPRPSHYLWFKSFQNLPISYPVILKYTSIISSLCILLLHSNDCLTRCDIQNVVPDNCLHDIRHAPA